MQPMSMTSRTALVLAIGFLLGTLVSVTGGVFAERDEPAELPYEQARTLAEALERVRQAYVEPVSDEELMEHAVRGMLSGLDDYSTYLDAEEYQQMQDTTSGRYGGLGLEVTQEDGVITVISPIAGTPAAEAGLEAGDRLISVNGESLEGMSLEEAVTLMRGEPGTRIVLGVLSEGADQPREVEIIREQIQTQSVNSRLLSDGIGYVRITHFRDEVGDQAAQAIRELSESNDGHLGGLILDMRNNPGGILRGAVSVSDLFLDSGLIVAAEGRMPSASFSHNASEGDMLLGKPIVVLVNQGSASASEIVAGALQDHGRAVVMGENSFGKGTVQTIMPLSQGAAMKLTTARYITESGRTIQDSGIAPDLEVTDEGIEIRDNAPLADRIRDAWQAGEEAPDEAVPEDDKTLGHALRLIRGLSDTRETEDG